MITACKARVVRVRCLSVCLSACQAVSWVPSVAFLCHFALFTTLRQIKQSSPHSLANLQAVRIYILLRIFSVVFAVLSRRALKNE